MACGENSPGAIANRAPRNKPTGQRVKTGCTAHVSNGCCRTLRRACHTTGRRSCCRFSRLLTRSACGMGAMPATGTCMQTQRRGVAVVAAESQQLSCSEVGLRLAAHGHHCVDLRNETPRLSLCRRAPARFLCACYSRLPANMVARH